MYKWNGCNCEYFAYVVYFRLYGTFGLLVSAD